MRILHVVDQMDPKRGGVCQAIRTIIKGTSHYDTYNEVVSLDDPNAHYISQETLTIHALGPASNPWTYSKKFKGWLIDNLVNYDKVIVHGLWQYHSYAVYLAINYISKTGIPVNSDNPIIPEIYVMPHGMLDPYFQRASGRKLKAIRNSLYWKFIEEKIINSAQALLFTCEEEKRLARFPFNPYKPKKESVVGLGVEAPPEEHSKMYTAFSEQCAGLNGSRYILFLSRIHEKKGVDILINAYGTWRKDLLAKSAPNKQHIIPKLVIAGPGIDSAYGKSITRLINSEKALMDSVLFPGMLINDSKWGAFYSCDAFILPSHQENFGIAVVEAMACGKPTLISDQVNIWREIDKENAGIVYPDTPEGTLKMILKWAKMSGDERLRMGENAKTAYKNYFTVENTSERLLNALK